VKRLLPVVAALILLAACTPGEATAWHAHQELGANELQPRAYMSAGASSHPNPGIRESAQRLGFWCDEFAGEMLRRAGHHPVVTGDPASLARQYPLATPPYQPGDLVFVTFAGRDLHDHVGILSHADGDHLWVLDGNWPTGLRTASGKSVQGVVLNERHVGDGAVTELRRP
jgi:hypothetical protein